MAEQADAAVSDAILSAPGETPGAERLKLGESCTAVRGMPIPSQAPDKRGGRCRDQTGRARNG
ncbi:MAG: hypothetical protein FDZ70_06945 [Actinobacteria bacterium]|nr:MAG: hypothetical protein FDZ70_06945 [Actinomycetota bacterium]